MGKRSMILTRLASDAVLDAAYAWLCRRRRDWPAIADIWSFRHRWPEGHLPRLPVEPADRGVLPTPPGRADDQARPDLRALHGRHPGARADALEARAATAWLAERGHHPETLASLDDPVEICRLRNQWRTGVAEERAQQVAERRKERLQKREARFKKSPTLDHGVDLLMARLGR
jgi:hypothetical protein